MKFIDNMINDIKELMIGYHSLPDEYENRVGVVRVHVINHKYETNLLEKLLLALPKDAKLVYVDTIAMDLSIKYFFASTEFPITPEFHQVPEIEVLLAKEQGPHSADQHRSWKVNYEQK